MLVDAMRSTVREERAVGAARGERSRNPPRPAAIGVAVEAHIEET